MAQLAKGDMAMLNTQVCENGILVTDNNGNEVGQILHKNGFWVVSHMWMTLDIKAFKSLQAAEYYMLAAHLEFAGS